MVRSSTSAAIPPRRKRRGCLFSLLLGAGFLVAIIVAYLVTPLDFYGGRGGTVPRDEDPAATTLPTSEPTQGVQPTPSPTAEPTGAPGSAAQAILERCVNGTVAFRPPSPMKQGETVEFAVRAVLAGSPVDPGKGLPEGGPAEYRNTPTCERMRADLTGPGMDIRRTGSESGEISLPSKGVGEWTWLLTPRESGTQYLTLRLFVPGPNDTDITLETFRERIQVDVGVVYVTAEFVKEYFPVLGLSIPVLGGGLVWLLAKRRKGKHAEAAPVQ